MFLFSGCLQALCALRVEGMFRQKHWVSTLEPTRDGSPPPTTGQDSWCLERPQGVPDRRSTCHPASKIQELRRENVDHAATCSAVSLWPGTTNQQQCGELQRQVELQGPGQEPKLLGSLCNYKIISLYIISFITNYFIFLNYFLFVFLGEDLGGVRGCCKWHRSAQPRSSSYHFTPNKNQKRDQQGQAETSGNRTTGGWWQHDIPAESEVHLRNSE